MAPGLDLGGMGMMFDTFLQVGKIVGTALGTIIGILIIFGIPGFFFFRTMMYRYPVEIYAIRSGGSAVLGRDRVRIHRIKKTNTVKARLYKRKLALPNPPQNAYFVNEKKGFEFKLYKFGDSDYVWITTDEWKKNFENVDLVPIQSAERQFFAQEQKEIEQRNKPKDWLQKYGFIINLFILFLGLIIAIWIIMSRLETMTGMIAGAMANAAQQCPCM